MKLITIILILIIASCRSEEKARNEFLSGEWVSDSISSLEADHWKEFLFIDSNGSVTRATWGEILDQNLSIKDLTIVDNGAKKYGLQIIDSNSIIISNLTYYGAYYRKSWNGLEEYNKSLEDFRIAATNKNKIIGDWQANSFEITQHESNLQFDSVYLSVELRRNFMGSSSLTKVKMHIQENSKLKISYDNNTQDYVYQINRHDLDLYRSDYLINMRYEIFSDTLTVFEFRHGVERKINFVKIR
jgi:hypothetical protein